MQPELRCPWTLSLALTTVTTVIASVFVASTVTAAAIGRALVVAGCGTDLARESI